MSLVPIRIFYIFMPLIVLIKLARSVIHPPTLATNLVAEHLLIALISAPRVCVDWGIFNF